MHRCLSIHRKVGNVVLFHVNVNTLISEKASRWINYGNQFKLIDLLWQQLLFCDFFFDTLWIRLLLGVLCHDFITLYVLILRSNIYTSQEELVCTFLKLSNCFTILSENLSPCLFFFSCWSTLIILWLIGILWQKTSNCCFLTAMSIDRFTMTCHSWANRMSTCLANHM